MISYNGKYLFIDPQKVDTMQFISYDKGDKTEDWLNFCYDRVAPSSRLIEVVSVRNMVLPMWFCDVDIIVDEEGLLRPPVILNPIATALADQPIFGCALLAYRALDASGEGFHSFPLSSSPYYDKIIEFFRGCPDAFGTLIEEETKSD